MKKDDLYSEILELVDLKNIDFDVSTGALINNCSRNIFVIQK